MFGETETIQLRLPKSFIEALKKIAEESYLSVDTLLLSELDKSELFSIARELMLKKKDNT